MANNLNIGDTVRFLNSVGGGKVVRIQDNIAYVEDDGFETPVLVRECVVVAPAQTKKPEIPAVAPAKTLAEIAPPPSKSSDRPKADEMPAPETPEGEKLNVVLAFEPADIKRLSNTTFDTYLVNDSNYWIYFTCLSRSDSENEWTARYAGVVEPGIQLFLFEVLPQDLPTMDRLAVQLIAFKRDKPFTLKPAVNFEQRLDTTKFARLHCFKPNPYFDADVIALDIVKNDVPVGRKTEADSNVAIEKILLEKERADRRVPRPVQKRDNQRHRPFQEIDLHATELTDSTAGMGPAEILNMQIDKFREVMDANLRYPGTKIVFIHGKGEGVLRQALLKELNYRYKDCEVADASFQEYGYGATQVTIHASKDKIQEPRHEKKRRR